MTERVKEIGIHKEMLLTQTKTAETERQTIRLKKHYHFPIIMASRVS